MSRAGDWSRFAATAEAEREFRSRGLHLGQAFYVSRRGEVLLHAAAGERAPGRPLDVSSPMLWLSAGKPLTAALVCRLWQQGLLELDRPVTDFLPEFTDADRAGGPTTIRQLLTHSAGLHEVDAGFDSRDWAGAVAAVCEAGPPAGWNPRTQGAYDKGASWFLLGEIAARVTGLSFAEALEREVLQRLKMDRTSNGRPIAEGRAAEVYQRSKGELVPSPRGDAATIAKPSPGGNTWGPVADLGRFYEAMLAAIAGESSDLLDATTANAMVARHRVGLFDEVLRHDIDFGLGVIVNSGIYGADTVPYGYGEAASRRAFGHGGAQSSIGFADPETGLVVVVVANTLAGEPQHQRRNRTTLAALEEDLRGLGVL